MSVKNIIFYNNFHKGDIHLSRQMVYNFIKSFPNYNYSYIHKHGDYIIKDVGIKYINFNNYPKLDTHKDTNDTLYFNTWYGAYGQKYQNSYGVTFDTLYHVFNKHLEKMKSSWSKLNIDPINLYPAINWNHFNKRNIGDFVNKTQNFKKKILISNGDVLSGQSHACNLSGVINKLAKEYPNYLFIYTSRKGVNSRNNVVYTGDITKMQNCDLNEISYLSKFCNIIVGRSSGPYSFAMTRDNLFDENKVMLSFSSIGRDDGNYWLHSMQNKIKYKAKILNFGLRKEYDIKNKIVSFF